MRYRDAGVDVTRGDAIKEALARAVRATWTSGVVPLPGGFAGVMRWPGDPAGAALVAATMDGVGTKLHLAARAGRLAEAAADLVYHGANDLLVHGARPVALLDYIAQSRLDSEVVLAVVEGLSRACREVGAVLLGGETAEMPDTYLPGVVDVAGCMIGAAESATLLDGRAVRAGDVLLGLASQGLHTNGFSLARAVLESSPLALEDALPGGGGETVGAALLAPHRWYGPALLPAIARGRVHALAHITGGGIAGNLVRVLPENCRAEIDARSWRPPALFEWLMTAGQIPLEDARRAFNMGIGMIAVCAAGEAGALSREWEAAGERVLRIGTITAGSREVKWSDAP
jgi:phosphoribosylformylglycinamidine cyclo-ligase